MAGTRKGKWVRHSEGEWRALLSRYRTSGLSVAAYCRREAISAASFYRWRDVLGKEGQDRGEGVGDESTPVFVDVGALNSITSAKPRLELKIDLGDGLVLHLVRN